MPYLLSNLLLVTASLTFIAGNGSTPSAWKWYSRCTPVVVSSVTPFTDSAIAVYLPGFAGTDSRSSAWKTFSSADQDASSDGTAPACSNSLPLITSIVASPPSSRIMFGSVPGHVMICSVHHQYSVRVSPFHANTGTPCGDSGVPSGPTTTAAAASSWVEKMLHEAHRTSAPSAVSVSISTAVCTVMWIDPAIRAPARGCSAAYSSRNAIRPGISCSARRICLRPASASDRSATLNSTPLTD